MNRNKKPLYRKVNTKARGVHHRFGGDYSDIRRKESAVGMQQGVQRGLDYTPLFRFLLSCVGEKWNDVFSEAASRLDKPEPIFWLVTMGREEAKDFVLVGESSYYSGLYVDDSELLQIVNPSINETTLEPSCSCCTHTFNGVVFTKKHRLS